MNKKAEVILHWIIIVTTTLAVGAYFVAGPDALGSVGFACFKYFTTDSNILAAIASVLCLIYMRKGENPKWLSIFHFISTVAVAVTLLIVIVFLAPSAIAATHNARVVLRFYAGNTFVLHLSTPVLAIINYCISSHDQMLSKWETLWGVLTVFIYSIVYVVMVVLLGIWKDWYGFTFGGRNAIVPIVMLCMYLFAAAVSFGIRKLCKK